MIRRLALITAGLILVAFPALASAPAGLLPHDSAPYYHGRDDGPVSMSVAPDGSMWAVWAYDSGTETDIAVSSAIGGSWTVPQLVGAFNERNDVDPRLAFLADGTPVIAFWHAGDGQALRDEVLLTFFIDGNWTSPGVVSSSTMNARGPSFFDAGDELDLGFVEIDPGTGDGGVSILPVKKPVPGGGTNGPDPIPTFTIEGGREIPNGEQGDKPGA